MAVPDFQSLMLPLLRIAGDGRDHRLADVRDRLARELGLSVADCSELLPSGRQARFANRVAWARAYLQQSGLLESPQRAHLRITPAGGQVLSEAPERIDIRYLERFPSFLEFRRPGGSTGGGGTAVGGADGLATTPEEALENAHTVIRAKLASDLLERVKEQSSGFFEKLVVALLNRLGYGRPEDDSGQVVGGPGDEGIDGIIREDRLGLEMVYVQAKKWDRSVGRPEIQKFVGALHGRRARKGVFITTGTFSDEAEEYVRHIEPKVALIDGRRLAELMIDADLGVSTEQTFTVKRLDLDWFEEG